MPDHRVYVGPDHPGETGSILLSEAETHHLVAVNRARPGDPVTAFDGRGREWTCRLEGLADRRHARLAIQASVVRPAPACHLVLGQSLPKGGTMDEIVRQATELGAAVVAPLETARVELRLDSERAEKKHAKWRAHAVEAAKQCGNPFLPEIAPIRDLAAFLASPEARDAELRLVASLRPDARPLAALLRDFRASHGGRPPSSAAWLVGPEGDLTPEESAAALAAGWLPASLGPLVLRCDTAAAAALAVLRCDGEG